MEKIAPSALLNCSIMVIKDFTPLTPPSARAELFFKCKQHTIHNPRGPANIYMYLHNGNFTAAIVICLIAFISFDDQIRKKDYVPGSVLKLSLVKALNFCDLKRNIILTNH